MLTFARRLAFLLALAALLILSSCAKTEESSSAGADPLSAAWNDYTLGEFDRAVAKFETALASAPAGEERQKVLYGLATTWNLRRPGEDPAKARELYQQVIDADPKSDLAAWSCLALARMKHLVPVGEDPDYNEVRKAYDDVIARYPNHLAAKEAFLYKMAMLVATLKPAETKQAIAQLEEFVKDPKTPFRGPCYSLLAVAHTTLNEPEARLQAEIDSLNNTEIDPANPFNEFAWQYWNIATIAEFEVGNLDLAREYYKKLIAEYPRDKRVFAAKRALERMDALEEKLRKEM